MMYWQDPANRNKRREVMKRREEQKQAKRSWGSAPRQRFTRAVGTFRFATVLLRNIRPGLASTRWMKNHSRCGRLRLYYMDEGIQGCQTLADYIFMLCRLYIPYPIPHIPYSIPHTHIPYSISHTSYPIFHIPYPRNVKSFLDVWDLPRNSRTGLPDLVQKISNIIDRWGPSRRCYWHTVTQVLKNVGLNIVEYHDSWAPT